MILRAIRWTLAALVLAFGGGAWAQPMGTPVQPGYLTSTDCPSLATTPCFVPFLGAKVTYQAATVGASHGQVLAANSTHGYLMLHNPSQAGGNTIWCSVGGTAVVGAAGTLSIAPGQYVTQESNSFSSAAIDCIASGANTPLTIGTN